MPDSLPDEPTFVWQTPLASDGIGGVAAAAGVVIAGGRNATDRFDVFVALDAETGAVRWQAAFRAEGRLDYGNSPRATPVISGECAYLFGAFGDLRCVSLEDGDVLWERHLAKDYQTPKLDWGLTSTPILVDRTIIVQVGGLRGAVVALDFETGEEVWKVLGGKPGHGSFICVRIGDTRQVVGHDFKSLGGWDVATGKRLWTVRPPVDGDFQVPTPIFIDDGALGPRLFVTTENNGSRLFAFRPDGTLDPEPIAKFARLAPDIHTPVRIGDRLYGIHKGLSCLKIDAGLEPAWRLQDRAFLKYGSLIGATKSRRLLATMHDCRLILLEDQGDSVKELDRLTLLDDGTEMFAHPALANGRLYLRLGQSVACLELEPRADAPSDR